MTTKVNRLTLARPQRSHRRERLENHPAGVGAFPTEAVRRSGSGPRRASQPRRTAVRSSTANKLQALNKASPCIFQKRRPDCEVGPAFLHDQRLCRCEHARANGGRGQSMDRALAGHKNERAGKDGYFRSRPTDGLLTNYSQAGSARTQSCWVDRRNGGGRTGTRRQCVPGCWICWAR